MADPFEHETPRMRTFLEILADQEYGIGDLVYHRAASQPCAGIVTGICLRAYSLCYLITWGSDLLEKWHAGLELCRHPIPRIEG